MGRYFSDELFHLVGRADPHDDERNFQSLVKILRSGWISYPPHTSDWGATTLTYNRKNALLDGNLVVPEMVCFCDIPYEHLQDHVAKYGRFGLSVDKKYAIGFGTRPVTYFPYWVGGPPSAYGPTLLKDIDAAYRGFLEHIAAPLMDGERPWRKFTQVPDSPAQAADAVHAALLKDFLAFLKPFNADLPEDHPDYFYAEKEWRRLGNLKLDNQRVRRVVLAKGFEQRLADAVPEYTFKTDVAA